jgi:hypothetical protein
MIVLHRAENAREIVTPRLRRIPLGWWAREWADCRRGDLQVEFYRLANHRFSFLDRFTCSYTPG